MTWCDFDRFYVNDLFPNDPTQRWDSDGDGYGDNMAGTNGDAFQTTPINGRMPTVMAMEITTDGGPCTVMTVQTWHLVLSVGARVPGF